MMMRITGTDVNDSKLMYGFHYTVIFSLDLMRKIK